MKKILLLAFVALNICTAKANNIVVANATLSGQNTTAHTEIINFKVSWENSWRTSTNENNYDGAWIFVKFRKQGTTDWRHCTINTTGFTAGTGGTIKVPTDGKGAFIYKSADGIGPASYTGNMLIWNYGTDGILDNETVEIRVFALEMVYIPQGSYQLGSGGTEYYAFSRGTVTSPYTVTGSNITVGSASTNLDMHTNGTNSGTIPAVYPQGYNAFWIMKYECSQGQYADFLNNLDQAKATANLPTSDYTGQTPNITTAEPERAAGNMGWQKAANIADWSGLRPMTELEYEKACRGFNTPAVANEYAWGNTSILPVVAVDNAGAANEAVAPGDLSNANIDNVFSYRTRVGLFARTSAATRQLSGATYYGVLNMTDNANEICINAAYSEGRSVLEAINGDGYLAADGNTDIATWGAYQAYGIRGAAYNEASTSGRVSSRLNATYFTSFPSSEPIGFGIRMVRVAP